MVFSRVSRRGLIGMLFAGFLSSGLARSAELEPQETELVEDCDDWAVVGQNLIYNASQNPIGSVALSYSCECEAAFTTTWVYSNFQASEIEASVVRNDGVSVSGTSQDYYVVSPVLHVYNKKAAGRGRLTRASDGKVFTGKTLYFLLPSQPYCPAF